MKLYWHSFVHSLCLLNLFLSGCGIINVDDAQLENAYLVDRSNISDHRSAVKAGTVDPIGLAVQFGSAMRFPVGGAYKAYFCDPRKGSVAFGGFHLWHFATPLDGKDGGTRLHYLVFLNIHSNPKFTSEENSYDLRYEPSDICLYIQETGSYVQHRSNVIRVPRALIDQVLHGEIKTLPAIAT